MVAKIERYPAALMRAAFDYEPNTGRIFWKARTAEMVAAFGLRTRQPIKDWNARYAGREAFTADNGKGYRVSLIFGCMARAHRVAWAIHYGAWPALFLDHINGDRADNRISNLRQVDFVENGRNARLSTSNRSGQPGVQWYARKRKWRSRITVKGRKIDLGYYDLFSAAVAARKAAERKYGFSPSHGRSR